MRTSILILALLAAVGCATDVARIRQAEYGAVNVSAAALRGHAVYYKAATNNLEGFNRTLAGLEAEREAVKAGAVKIGATAELLEALLASYATNATMKPQVEAALSALLQNSTALLTTVTNIVKVTP